MAKTGFPVSGPAGLAEWLPLLGAICQVLASLGDEDETETDAPAKSGAVTGAGLQTDRKSGR